MYDMHGNVRRLCDDLFERQSSGSVISDPSSPSDGSDRVCRGGSWDDPPYLCRSAYRGKRLSNAPGYSVGFRVTLTIDTAKPLTSQTPPADPNRAAAEWVFANNGKLKTNVAPDKYITNVAELPGEEFRIIRIQELKLNLETAAANEALQRLGSLDECALIRITDSKFTDEGLAFLKRLPHLGELNLVRVPGVSGRGLVNLQESKNLKGLALSGSKIDDGGVEQIARFANLHFLDLNATGIGDSQFSKLSDLTELGILWLIGNPISDAGLTHMSAMTKLTLLQLRRTQVTSEGIARLQKTLPKCKILWDEQPPKNGDAAPPKQKPFD